MVESKLASAEFPRQVWILWFMLKDFIISYLIFSFITVTVPCFLTTLNSRESSINVVVHNLFDWRNSVFTLLYSSPVEWDQLLHMEQSGSQVSSEDKLFMTPPHHYPSTGGFTLSVSGGQVTKLTPHVNHSNLETLTNAMQSMNVQVQVIKWTKFNIKIFFYF